MGLIAVLFFTTIPAQSTTSDPLESFNRVMFNFNHSFLEYVVNPTTDLLGSRLPESVINAGQNIYSNFTEIEFLLNGILVGDPQAAAISTGRFVVNATLGIGGIFDVASSLGMNRIERDFTGSICQTGLAPGPYIVFPLVGPANLYSAAVLATGIAIEVYLLSFISTTLALADFLLIDIGGTASALRYMRDLPFNTDADPYLVQRTEHLEYVRSSCEKSN